MRKRLLSKFLLFSLCFVILFTMLCMSGCVGNAVSGENVKIDYALPDSVTFYPVYPDCDHISPLTYKNISEGDEDEYSFYNICEKCDHMYEYTIKRG